MNNDRLNEIMTELGEHFDSVLLLVSSYEDEVTSMKARRRGNVLTARGHAQNWLDTEKNEELAQEIKKTEEE